MSTQARKEGLPRKGLQPLLLLMGSVCLKELTPTSLKLAPKILTEPSGNTLSTPAHGTPSQTLRPEHPSWTPIQGTLF